jgi:ferrous iron transport protein B
VAEGSVAKGIFFAGGLNSPGVILFNAMTLLTDSLGVWLASGLTALGANEAVIGLVCDGVWGGVSSVLSFLPQILVLFLLFSILAH